MNNRRLPVCCLALLLVPLNAVVVLLHYSKRSQIDPSPLAGRIQLGHTRAQAVSAVGLSPGDYRTNSSVGYIYCCFDRRKQIAAHPTWQEVSWQFDRGEIILYVNEKDVVVTKVRGGGFAIRRAPWERVRDIMLLKDPFR
jgi:hypothetical protein